MAEHTCRLQEALFDGMQCQTRQPAQAAPPNCDGKSVRLIQLILCTAIFDSYETCKMVTQISEEHSEQSSEHYSKHTQKQSSFFNCSKPMKPYPFPHSILQDLHYPLHKSSQVQSVLHILKRTVDGPTHCHSKAARSHNLQHKALCVACWSSGTTFSQARINFSLGERIHVWAQKHSQFGICNIRQIW
jgi:hypothetical protein